MNTKDAAKGVVEAEWKRLLGSDRVDRNLLRAAYAEPRLRQLFPWVGMWELREYVGEADTAEAAVEMVADRLPSDCGQAIVGNRHDVPTSNG
ncbi:DUF6193 family natural product biosynthesis protein [Streptomyces flavidovirens]|uniref:DUF6193 family natural product biosynthesis protein n=1 Tax=Streptomyces flavidovirens TaxID=67298 RepID=UPI00048E2CAA|nr:DUF6193 family natural product biosynthesis protein [Streptomyces flavidovirens]